MKFEHYETSLEKENDYPKLVRDDIPAVVEKLTGQKVKFREMTDDKEYLKFMLRKVLEEAQELASAEDKEHIVEEAADLVELIEAILKFSEVDAETFKKVKDEKASKRGGFKKRILMLEKV